MRAKNCPPYLVGQKLTFLHNTLFGQNVWSTLALFIPYSFPYFFFLQTNIKIIFYLHLPNKFYLLAFNALNIRIQVKCQEVVPVSWHSGSSFLLSKQQVPNVVFPVPSSTIQIISKINVQQHPPL